MKLVSYSIGTKHCLLNGASCHLSLSTVVLNSRDWAEIVWLPEILHFKNQPCNRLYLKKPAGMHWLGYYDG